VPDRPPGGPQEAFALLGSPNHLALRDVARGGTGGFAGISYYGDLESNPDFVVRGNVGLELGLLEDRLRFGLMFPFDIDHQERDPTVINPDGDVPTFHVRGGGSDVRASVGFTLVDGRDTQAHVDMSVWIPSGGDPHGLGRVRLVPNLELQHRIDRLILRARIGAIVDTEEDDDFWAAGAVGVDYVILGPWSLGVELDAFGGVTNNEGAGGVAVGIGTAIDVADWVRLTGGVRVAPTDDFEQRHGLWTFVFAVRLTDLRN